MPINCKFVSVEDVIKFFEDDIDGIGKHGGHLRNEGIPDSIRQFQNWEFCELTENEFNLLVIPDGTRTLIKDKTDLDGFTKKNVGERLEKLQSSEDLDPLIVTELLPEDDPSGVSFYIKDGAKRAIAYKIYFENMPYRTVKTYLGKRKI